MTATGAIALTGWRSNARDGPTNSRFSVAPPRLAAEPAKSVYLAPHGRVKSRRRSHETTATSRSGSAMPAPNRRQAVPAVAPGSATALAVGADHGVRELAERMWSRFASFALIWLPLVRQTLRLGDLSGRHLGGQHIAFLNCLITNCGIRCS
jgi:hypothetical protein